MVLIPCSSGCTDKIYSQYKAEFSIQLHSHQDNFLPACFSRTKALGISAIFTKSYAFVQGNRSAIFTDNIQLQLRISGSFCTFYTGNS